MDFERRRLNQILEGAGAKLPDEEPETGAAARRTRPAIPVEQRPPAGRGLHEDQDLVPVGWELDAVLTHYTEEDLAGLLQVSRRTLKRWRAAGTGPPFRKFAGTIRYPAIDALRWARAQDQRPGADAIHDDLKDLEDRRPA